MRRLLLAALAATIAGIAGAVAQTYPARPLTMIVPFPAGGPTDTIARILSERMRATLGQPIVIENVSGAGATIGVTRVVRSAPDGYTLVIGNWTSHVGSPATYPIQYDTVKDFEPVSMLPIAPTMIIGRSSLPANDMGELIAWLKANPNKALAGIVSSGSPGHVSGLYFQNETGTRFQFVPYRGAAPAMQDLVAGQIDLRFGVEGSQTLPFLRGGQIKAFAMLAKTRWSAMPSIPTIDETGVRGLYISFWNGLWAPKGTPKDIVAKLNGAVVDALADPAVRQRLADLGLEMPTREQQTPDGLTAHHQAEIEKWWPVIKAATHSKAE